MKALVLSVVALLLAANFSLAAPGKDVAKTYVGSNALSRNLKYPL